MNRSLLSPALWISGTALVLAAGCGAEDLLGDGDDAFTQIYESNEFQECAGCHAPGAPGRTDDTEATMNWSTRDSAYSSLQGNASGLTGNFQGCNGVPFIGATAEESLLVAVFDQQVRNNFSLPDFPDCTGDSISDMTLKIGTDLPGPLLSDLKAWIDDGAPN